MLALLAVAAPASAQSNPAEARQARWDATAAQAIRLIEQPSDMSDDDVEQRWIKMRGELARQRDEALRVSRRGSLPEKIVAAQIGALGPLPKEGESEPKALTARREALGERLVVAREPIVAAENAQARASVLIKEIDDRLAAADARKRFERIASPLWPGSWSALIRDLEVHVAALGRDYRAIRADPARNAALISFVPMALILSLAALVIAVALQHWALRTIDRRLGAASSKGIAIVLTILRDMAMLIIPLVALALIEVTVIAIASKFPGFAVAGASLTAILLYLILGTWLGQSLFAPQLESQRFIKVSNETARDAYRTTVLLALLLGLETVSEGMEDMAAISRQGGGVLSLILVGGASYLLWRLADMLNQSRGKDADGNLIGQAIAAPHDHGSGIDYALLVGRALKSAAAISVILICVGYVELSRHILLPTLGTLVAVAIAILTFRRTLAIGHTLFGRFGDGHRPAAALLPVLLGLLLTLVTLPLIALIWGVRSAQLGDYYTTLTDGVSIGDVHVTVGDLFTFALVFAIGYGVTRWTQRLLQASILPRFQMDSGAQNALLTGMGYIGLTLSALLAITSAGLDLSSLAIVFGALSVGIGFGLQSVTSNFVSGIILLIERPIKEGDWIEVGGYAGIVARISVRSTRLRTFDRDDVIIPNSELVTGMVRNRTYSGTMGRIEIEVGIAYGSDIDAAIAVLREAVGADRRILAQPEPMTLLDRLDDSAMVMRLLCFVDDVNQSLAIRSALLTAVYRGLHAAGIEIPFPQRTVTIHHAETDDRHAGASPRAAS